MKVQKRDGSFQELSFDKVLYRLKTLKELEPVLNNVMVDLISQKVISQIYDGVLTSELDELAAKLCIENRFNDLEYEVLATRIIISNAHKNVPKTFYESMNIQYENGILNNEFMKVVEENRDLFNAIIDYKQDYTYDYFAYKTLEKSYLMKVNKKIVETPQYLLLRVAIAIHGNDIPSVINTYKLTSNKYFTHASPTLFNAGTKCPSYASCFLLGIEDSMKGIYKCLSDCAIISKYAGGIGVHISNIRAQGSIIRGTNGTSDGIVKMLKVFNETALYSNQSGRRNGSIAIYIEPWHADIFEFVELPLKHGDDKKRARDLFYALWVPDNFMRCVENDLDWYLMCPDECPGLSEQYSDAYEELYNKYINEKKYRKKVKARDLWDKILKCQIETGLPYISYKDSVNKKSNQKNLGTIKSSNLCVSGDTLILTDSGYTPIKQLENQNCNVWNGKEFSNVIVKQTGKNKQLLKLTFSNGLTLKCTKYHKFYYTDETNNIIEVSAENLKSNMKLLECEFPIEHNNLNNKLEKLSKILNDNNTSYNANINTIDIIKIDYTFIQETILLLQTLNIKCKFINITDKNSKYPISYYKLQLNKIACIKLKNLGLINTLVTCVINSNYIEDHDGIFVTDISNVPGLHDTYCFTEPKKNMGVFNGILTGNCNEINIYSDTEQYGTCNLASVSLPAFIEYCNLTNKYIFNYTKLEEVVDTLITNLNKIIDITFYSTPESEKANKSHRPVGLGVSGFSNVLYHLKIPFESEEAKKINLLIFETIYYASLKTSCNLAKKEGPYMSFEGSDFSKGILQFDYCNDPNEKNRILSGRYDWEALKNEIKEYGTRNSLLTALMPTASTSQILNNFESFEPITRNIFMRSVLSGDFSIINRYLIKDLIDLGLWNEDFFNKFKKSYGSIQTFEEVPKHLRDLYKDIYEISQKSLIDLSADRQYFIDQSQSLNIYFQNPTIKKLTSMHFYGWKKGLKTGMYYLRSDSATQAAQITVSKSTSVSLEEQKLLCSINNRENCDMCAG